jgi:hypothetical protein
MDQQASAAFYGVCVPERVSNLLQMSLQIFSNALQTKYILLRFIERLNYFRKKNSKLL